MKATLLSDTVHIVSCSSKTDWSDLEPKSAWWEIFLQDHRSGRQKCLLLWFLLSRACGSIRCWTYRRYSNPYQSQKDVINKGSQCTCKCNIQPRSGNHYGRGKAICITYSECESVALVIQNARRVRHIILISVTDVALHCFSAFSQNGTIFGRSLLNTKCAFWFSLQLLSETFLILRGNEIKNVYWSSRKAPVVLVIC